MFVNYFGYFFQIICRKDRKSTRLNSSHLVISYAVFCLKKKNKSNYRMGCVDFGRIWVLRVFGRYLIFRTSGCAGFGFRVVAKRRNDAPQGEWAGKRRES